MDDDRSPCLVGWATATRHDGEPLDAWAEVLRATGVPPARIDSLDVVYCQSWQYDDPPQRLADAVGAAPRRLHYSGIGGTTPHVLLRAAAARIAAGESAVCAVVGGEALDTVRRLKKAGERPAWSHREPERSPFPFEAPFHPAEIAHEVFQAYTTFALRDVARRAHLGLGVEEHRASLGASFAPMTAVAAANPHAWFRDVAAADELWRASPDNRMVAFPYTKRLVSVMDVDLASAVVLASAAAADELGVPRERRVHLRATAYGEDPVYVAEHPQLWRSPAMAAVLGSTLASGGAALDDVGHLDLYSCFPSSVSFALDALGIDGADGRAPFTVTGGLPYFGGAGSCYCVAQVAAMADVLVEDAGSLGLTTGVGMHMTKHAAALWSTDPGAGYRPVPDLAAAGDAVPVVDEHRGPATVAAYTVHHGRDGAPTDGLVVADVAGGRAYGKVRDPGVLEALETEEWVGREVELADGGGGVNEVRAR